MSFESWQLARQAIANGELVAFPTDTVYGLACDPYNVEAIARLYAAKSRDRLKALPLLLADVDIVSQVAPAVPRCAEQLGGRFWPGALTLVVAARPELPKELGGECTIAVRVPDHSELRDFLAACGGALAASSANLSGMPDAVTAQQAADYLGDSVAIIVDEGPTRGGVPSTVVDCTHEPPKVLRHGAIPDHEIEAALKA
jgi:L-threonylcarbamoyladenylate synthase